MSTIDPFALFCAYHLGLTEDWQARPQNIHQVARRFRVSPDEIRAALEQHGMTPEDVIARDFDVAAAQVDMSLAPPEMDRRELARDAYRRWTESEGTSRDWERELAEDAAEVSKDPMFDR